ncbi:hypothetical protein P7C71_g5444, partial [Lecanoromycetidae sp. Uapishka_2]
MTANPRPNNATPQRLHLPPHLVPRMPFSSPMGEEVMSPTTPNASRSPPQHQIQLSQNRSAEQENATLGSNRTFGKEYDRGVIGHPASALRNTNVSETFNVKGSAGRLVASIKQMVKFVSI